LFSEGLKFANAGAVGLAARRRRSERGDRRGEAVPPPFLLAELLARARNVPKRSRAPRAVPRRFFELPGDDAVKNVGARGSTGEKSRR